MRGAIHRLKLQNLLITTQCNLIPQQLHAKVTQKMKISLFVRKGFRMGMEIIRGNPEFIEMNIKVLVSIDFYRMGINRSVQSSGIWTGISIRLWDLCCSQCLDLEPWMPSLEICKITILKINSNFHSILSSINLSQIKILKVDINNFHPRIKIMENLLQEILSRIIHFHQVKGILEWKTFER